MSCCSDLDLINVFEIVGRASAIVALVGMVALVFAATAVDILR